jgi:hypothetical protein
MSPVAFVVFAGKKDAFKVMLQSKIPLDLQLGNGNRLIHFALSSLDLNAPEANDKLDMIKIIIENIPDVNVVNSEVVGENSPLE